MNYFVDACAASVVSFVQIVVDRTKLDYVKLVLSASNPGPLNLWLVEAYPAASYKLFLLQDYAVLYVPAPLKGKRGDKKSSEFRRAFDLIFQSFTKYSGRGLCRLLILTEILG